MLEGSSALMLHRPIRSFVLRQGRVSNAQRRAHESLLPQFGIPYSPQVIDLDHSFGRRAPKALEIGFGMGETTARIAAANPGTDYLAIEVHSPGVGALLKKIGEEAIANIRVVQHDAVEVMRDMVPAGSLAAIHVFFPDPWPKKRHHKRRLLQRDFVELAVTRLAPGGVLHVATDWREYADEVLALLEATPGLANTARGFAPRPASRPETKFEQRGRRLGHGVFDMVFRKKSGGGDG